ncbi:MAG: cysteine desulfurase [Myxococcales bacterium]|nr:cysteine desulfurase [Myxococcales bacterium]
MRIYLDHNATTPLRPEVVEAMARVLRERFGNPSSTHAEGRAARAELDRAREQLAALLRVPEREIVFTGSATEANNAALAHAARAHPTQPLAATTTEHPSVEEPLADLEAAGRPVLRVPVDADGRIDLAALDAALDRAPALLSVIWANNETGTLQPIAEIAERAAARGVPLHLDATQAVGKVPVELDRLPAAFVSGSAHKFNGPKGVGFLVVRDATFSALLRGGPQEARRRGGTENLSGIVGMGVAAELAGEALSERAKAHAALRDRLWDGIRASIPRVRRNGSPAHALPNTLNVEFIEAAGDVALQALDLEGIGVSAGAACASGSISPSRVLVAMGRSAAEAHGSLRFSVGFGTEAQHIDRTLALLPDIVERARGAFAA